MGERRYVTVNWDYVDSLSRKVAFQILEDHYNPDCIVALAKGGWFVARILSDYLGVERLVSLDVKGDEDAVIRGNLLVVDDLISTGKTMKRALDAVKGDEVRTASLLMLQNSDFVPDYLGEYLWDYTWVVFPWNFVEDVSELVVDVLRRKGVVSQWSLKGLLFSEFGLDPLNLEISMRGRFEELLMVLEKRGVIESLIEGGRRYWRLKDGGDQG